jgi:hypothetical protein
MGHAAYAFQRISVRQPEYPLHNNKLPDILYRGIREPPHASCLCLRTSNVIEI